MILVSIVGCVHLYCGNWMELLAVPEQRHARQERFTATPQDERNRTIEDQRHGSHAAALVGVLGVRRRGCLLQPIVHMTSGNCSPDRSPARGAMPASLIQTQSRGSTDRERGGKSDKRYKH